MRTALIVLLVAAVGIAGYAVAASHDDGKMAQARVGPVATAGPARSGFRNDPGAAQSGSVIPLSHSTFEQRAGETVLLTGAVAARPSAPCSDGDRGWVEVDVTPPPGTRVGKVTYDFNTNEIEGDLTTGLPPPADDTTRHLTARVADDCQDAELLVSSLRIQVVRLRP